MIFKEIMRNYLSFMKTYTVLIREIYTVYIVIINFLSKNNTIDKINNNSDILTNNLSKIHDLYKSITDLKYNKTNEFDDTIFNVFNNELETSSDIILENKTKLYKLYKNGSSKKVCSKLDINDSKINIFLNNINVDNFSKDKTILKDNPINYFDIKLSSDNKGKIIKFFDTNIQISKSTSDKDFNFYKYLKTELIDKCIDKIETSQSIIEESDNESIKIILQDITSNLITYEANIDSMINTINNPSILIDEDANKNFFDMTNKNQIIENKFCDKMKKLDKPNKKHLVFKRFSQDIIEKKKNYINNLYEKIKKLHDSQNANEIYNTNIDRLYSHNISKKKYDAIVKGIDNIKNRNKIKINLT